MDVSENSGTPKSSILIGFSIINHPFGDTTIFGNTLVDIEQKKGLEGKSIKTTFGISYFLFCHRVKKASVRDHSGYMLAVR